jgi:hypothetical protein
MSVSRVPLTNPAPTEAASSDTLVEIAFGTNIQVNPATRATRIRAITPIVKLFRCEPVSIITDLSIMFSFGD